jgi:hypothetical protein
VIDGTSDIETEKAKLAGVHLSRTVFVNVPWVIHPLTSSVIEPTTSSPREPAH